MQLTFIGDVHGKMNLYVNIIKSLKNPSVQVGDFGLGFVPNPLEYAGFDPKVHRFIRGNHDHPGVCREAPNWIPDGEFDELYSIFYMGGALSIDQYIRTRDIDWWEEEELSYIELSDMIEKYERVLPRIMVTHDCPAFLPPLIFRGVMRDYPSRTAYALQSMWEIHRPEFWIFGHWHDSVDKTIMGTRFICLNELETINVDIPQVRDVDS